MSVCRALLSDRLGSTSPSPTHRPHHRPKHNQHNKPKQKNPPAATTPPPPHTTPTTLNNKNKPSCGNVAAVLAFDEQLNREFKMFKEVPESEFGQNPERRNLVPYFL